MARSRKGMFTLFLLVLYIVAAIAALLMLTSGLMNKFPKEGIGATQGALLEAQANVDGQRFFTRTAATTALTLATNELYHDQSSLFSVAVGDGRSGECDTYLFTLWNACVLDRDPHELEKEYQQRVQELLADETSHYPRGGFSTPYTLSFKDGAARFSTSERWEEPLLVEITPTEEELSSEENIGEMPLFSPPARKVEQLSWPLSAKAVVTSCFGPRVGVKEAVGDFHTGMDLAPNGMVVAAADGVVINDPSNTEFGTVWIQHSDTLSTRYLHLKNIKVHRGDVVKRGQVLGTPSNTGCAAKGCGVHLHFEVLVRPPPTGAPHVRTSRSTPGWYAVNPACFFPTLTKSDFSPQATQSCFAPGAPQPPQTAYCDEYHFSLEPAVAYQPGTALRKREEGEAVPPTAVDDVMGSEPRRPESSSLRQDLQEKFHTTELNRDKYGWDRYVLKVAAEEGVDPALLFAIITQESLGDPHAISSTGCAGLMQICYNTGKDFDGLRGHMTLCRPRGCSYGSCSCNEENDRRFDPETNIRAGAFTLKQKMAYFTTYPGESRLQFGIAAYNVGEGVVLSAIRGTGKTNPTWEDVLAYLKGHPELISYFSTRDERERKVREVATYVQNVMALYRAWNGGELPSTGRAGGGTGGVRSLGSLLIDPSFAVEFQDPFTSFLDLVGEVRGVLETCKDAAVPGVCLEKEAAAHGWEDCADSYPLALYQAFRDCAENEQFGCQCSLPRPGPGKLSLSKEGEVWRGSARVEGVHLDQPFGGKTVKVAGKVPKKLLFTPQGVTVTFDDKTVKWQQGWALEKDGDGGLLFRQDASDAPLCAPVKRHEAFCKKVGDETAHFALTILDEQPPRVRARLEQGEVVLESPDQDVSFYNLYEETKRPVLQLRAGRKGGARFDVAPYAGKTLFVTAVDRVGNEGARVSVMLQEE